MKHILLLLATLTLAASVPLLSAGRVSAAHSTHAVHTPSQRSSNMRRSYPHPLAQQSFSGYFPIIPFMGHGARGTVHVTIRGGQTVTTVSVYGVAPYSVHAIHIHAGSCASAYTGIHLYILGILSTNAAGAGSVSGYGPAPYIPGSRYVIVYDSLAPAVIVGCANLGSLARM